MSLEEWICPSNWPYDPWYSLFRRRVPLVAEVEASSMANRAWIHVTPDADGMGFTILYAEVPRHQYEEVLNSWDYDYYWLNVQSCRADNRHELERVLARWISDFEVLKPRFLSTSPF